MRDLEFEPRNLPPTHTMHLLNSANIQGALLWGKSSVIHILEGKFVKPATKVMRGGLWSWHCSFVKSPQTSSSVWVTHCKTCGPRYAPNTSGGKVDVGGMNQLLTWRVMCLGQWVLYSEVFSGRRDLCLLNCLVSHPWDRKGCGWQLSEHGLNYSVRVWETITTQAVTRIQPKPFKSNLSPFPVPF